MSRTAAELQQALANAKGIGPSYLSPAEYRDVVQETAARAVIEHEHQETITDLETQLGQRVAEEAGGWR